MSYNPTSSDNPMSKHTQPETDVHSGTEAQLLDVVAMPLKGRHRRQSAFGSRSGSLTLRRKLLIGCGICIEVCPNILCK